MTDFGAIPSNAPIPVDGLAIVPSATIRRNVGSQSIPDQTWTKVLFDVADLDQGHGGTPHFDDTNDRLVCRVAGTYLVTAAVRWVVNIQGIRGLAVYRNGTGTPAEEVLNNGRLVDVRAPLGTNVSGTLSANAVADFLTLAVNDYLEMAVFQTTGAALSLDSFSGARVPRLSFVRLTG